MNGFFINKEIRAILQRALREDLGCNGDVTTQGIFGCNEMARAVISSKSHGILAGAYLIAPLFRMLDRRVVVFLKKRDGARLRPGSIIGELRGPIWAILAGERTALNLLQRLSGIATRTAGIARTLRGSHAVLFDTRKTTPGLRILEKRAVRAGGGRNHRMGLGDMALVKNTHIQAAGGVSEALRRVRASLRRRRLRLPVEVEVSSIGQFREALAAKPDIIMLDNMNIRDMRRCVALARRSGRGMLLEASGGVSEASAAAIARTGVHRISAGCITHSAPALDMHLTITGPSHRRRG